MANWQNEPAFETLLGEERQRLVRLCAWFTGSPEAAEDLAQETLIAAWKNRQQLTSPDGLKPWTSAIARNICLNWSRQQHRELAHRTEGAGGAEALEDAQPANEPGAGSGGGTLEHALDRRDLARLLNQALALLPADTTQMLVAHYLHQTPQAEIAAKFGLNPGTVAVRLQRGRLALQKALRGSLQAEALAFGLVEEGGPRWEETNIWCPLCGKSRLLGRYQREVGAGQFALRCPTCNPGPESSMVGLDLSIPFHARLLEGVKSFKPAYTRLKTFIAGYFYQALASGGAACPACGGAVQVRMEHNKPVLIPPYRGSELRATCSRCDWASSTNLTGLVMALPEAQQFWRENPRIHTLPLEEVEAQGVRALVTRLRSLSTAAELAVISQRDTLETIGVHTTPRH